MSESLSTVCKSCGMCCNGTLFANLVLEPGEEEAFGKEAGVYTDADGTTRLPLGCSHFSETSGCEIYQKRPRICSGFKCILLFRVERQKFTVAEGVSIADELHEMLGALQQKCRKLMPQVEWPYVLVGHGALSRLMTEAESRGARISSYDLHQITLMQRYIVQYVRLFFRPHFMQSHVEAEMRNGEKSIKLTEEALVNSSGRSSEQAPDL